MRRLLVAVAVAKSAALALVAAGSRAGAQALPDSLVRNRVVRTEYDSLADSTTRRVSAYAAVDTSLTPPDTFAVELSQRWRGRGAAAPVAPVDLGLGRTRAEGLRGGGGGGAGRTLLWPAPRRPAVLFLLDGPEGARRIRLEQSEYVSDAGRSGGMTFETAWYRIAPGDLRRIAEATQLRVRVGDRELWLDPAWRRVAADIVAGQGPGAEPVRKSP